MKFPSEHMEQTVVAGWLRRRGIWFFAVPNGAKMGAREAAKMKREGLEPGVLDIWVVDRGILLALEMKSRDPNRTVTADQKRWLEHVDSLPLLRPETALCYGAEKAINKLQELGFD